MTPDAGFELRHLRAFVAVAEHRSFTRAASDLHVAQQAVSQSIIALERSLGVTLLRRSPRRVQLTAEGAVFLVDCRRILAAANRAAQRVQAAARGEIGTLRLTYTLTTVWETIPRLLTRLAETQPQLKLEAREAFGGDVAELLSSDRCDIAIAPRTSYPSDFHTQVVRCEPLRVALSTIDSLARRKRLALTTLADRTFEVWPRHMAPGFYDTVVGTCRAAGFEPKLDERAAGNTVWGNIARGRGVALINASLVEQLPRGIVLVELAQPTATLTYDAVWHQDKHALIVRALEVAAQLAEDEHWLLTVR